MIRSKSLNYPLVIFFSFHFADSLLTSWMTYCSVFLFLPYLPSFTHSSTFQHAIKNSFLCAFHFLFSNNFIISSIFLRSCKNRASQKRKRKIETSCWVNEGFSCYSVNVSSALPYEYFLYGEYKNLHSHMSW